MVSTLIPDGIHIPIWNLMSLNVTAHIPVNLMLSDLPFYSAHSRVKDVAFLTHISKVFQIPPTNQFQKFNYHIVRFKLMQQPHFSATNILLTRLLSLCPNIWPKQFKRGKICEVSVHYGGHNCSHHGRQESEGTVTGRGQYTCPCNFQGHNLSTPVPQNRPYLPVC